MNPGYGQQGFGQGRWGNSPIEFLPLAYYLNLLTSQYRNSTKLNQFLEKMLQKFDDVSQALVQLEVLMDVDNAYGAMLDAIGSRVGASRLVGFTPSNGVSPNLDDNTYRVYIKAKAVANLWDSTIDGLQTAWSILFPQFKLYIQDNQNMTATVYVIGSPSSILIDMIKNGYIVPRPEGVQYSYVVGHLPAFGFGQNTSFIAGFGQGMWN